MSNVKVYNLPAGTGKTYQIVQDINKKISQGKDKILYITYTNRAKDEARKKIKYFTPSLQIDTVHSFVNEFLKNYLKEEKVVRFIKKEVFKNEIGPDEKGFYKYQPKKESTQGEIGHDDLMKVFTYLIVHEDFKGLQKHLLRLFDFIYIDEFQDLNLSFIFNMIRLYNSNMNHSKSKLFIYGDTTQAIYDPAKSYQEERERYCSDQKMMDEILEYKETAALYNYRSSKEVIDLLNKFRGDPDKIQKPSKTTKTIQRITPSFSYNQKITSKELRELKNYIIMFGTNEQKYRFLKCTKLFEIYQDIYGYNSEINFDSDILLNYQKDLNESNPDPLMNFMENVFYLRKLMEENRPLGELLVALKAFPFEKREDKVITKENLNQLRCFKEHLTGCEFKDFTLSILISKITDIFEERNFDESKLWNKRWKKQYQNRIKKVPFKEFEAIFQEREKQQVSTLHGSKGESHDNVLIDLSEGFNRPRGSKQYVSNAYKIYRALLVMKKFSQKHPSFTIHRFEKVMKELSKDQSQMRDIYRPICEQENREEFHVFSEMRRDLYTFNLLYVSFSRAREHVHILFSEDYQQFKYLMRNLGFEEKEFNLEGRN